MTPRILAAAALAALTLSTSAYADAGSPDPHFGTNGVQRLDTTGGQYESAVALLADGKLIVTNRGPNDEHAQPCTCRGQGTGTEVVNFKMSLL